MSGVQGCGKDPASRFPWPTACEAKGHVSCQKQIDCPNCSPKSPGVQKIPCPKCSGKGAVDCEPCAGAGISVAAAWYFESVTVEDRRKLGQQIIDSFMKERAKKRRIVEIQSELVDVRKRVQQLDAKLRSERKESGLLISESTGKATVTCPLCKDVEGDEAAQCDACDGDKRIELSRDSTVYKNAVQKTDALKSLRAKGGKLQVELQRLKKGE